MSPSYVPPDADQFTNPAEIIANDKGRMANANAFADQSLRNREFQLRKDSLDQQMRMNEIAQPLLLATGQAKDDYINASIQTGVSRANQVSDAFTRLPDMTGQINDLDPSDEQYDQKLATILGTASDNPALFQNLQSAATAAKAKRTAFLGTSAGAAIAGLQQDAISGVIPYDAYAKVKAIYKQEANSPQPDFTNVFSQVRDINSRKATAARGAFQEQLSQLGDYAPPLPPRLSMGVYDPEEIKDFGKSIAEAQKQRAEGVRQTNVATTKNQGALDVQEMKNKGRMDVTMLRFSTSPQAKSEQGKQLINMANSITNQIKNQNLSSDDRSRLQGQLDAVNEEMAKQLGVEIPAALENSGGTGDAAKALDSGINFLQKQIALGNDDFPKGTTLPGGITDPVQSGMTGIRALSGNIPSGMTPNQFRLQQLKQRKADLMNQNSSVSNNEAGKPAALSIGNMSISNPEDNSVFSPMLNKQPDASLTPETDHAIEKSDEAADAPAIQQPEVQKRTPPTAAITKLKANPQLAKFFDEKYGTGSAARYLNQ